MLAEILHAYRKGGRESVNDYAADMERAKRVQLCIGVVNVAGLFGFAVGLYRVRFELDLSDAMYFAAVTALSPAPRHTWLASSAHAP